MNYTPDLLVPVRTEMLAIIAAGVGDPAFLIYDDDEVLLATLVLDDPPGAVNGTTGQITLTPGAPESDAPAAGVAHSAVLVDGDGTALIEDIEVVQGVAPVAGKLVISSTNILLGATVELVSATIV